jgi:hypothetical protein
MSLVRCSEQMNSKFLTFANRYVFVIQKQCDHYEAGIKFYCILGEF